MALPLLPLAIGFIAGVATTLWAQERQSHGRIRKVRVYGKGSLPVDSEPVEDTVGLEARSRPDTTIH